MVIAKSLKSLKPWQVSTIGLILLTPDLVSKLVIVKADLDTVPEAHGMEIILPLDFKEKPSNVCGQTAKCKCSPFPIIGTYLHKMLKNIYFLND